MKHSIFVWIYYTEDLIIRVDWTGLKSKASPFFRYGPATYR